MRLALSPLAELGYPVPWDPERFLAVLNARKARGETSFSAVYNRLANGTTYRQHRVNCTRHWKLERTVRLVYRDMKKPTTKVHIIPPMMPQRRRPVNSNNLM